LTLNIHRDLTPILISGILLTVCIACALGALWLTRARKIIAGSAVDHGTRGEQRVSDVLTRAGYAVLTDLTLRHGGGTHQIDHIVRGLDRLWVIETKTWQGTAVGRPGGRRWTLYRPDGRPPVTAYNPLLQNRRHAEVIEKVCKVPVTPLVVSASALSLSPALTGLLLQKTSWKQKGLADQHRRWMEKDWRREPALLLFVVSLASLAGGIYEIYSNILGNPVLN
jgi:hypothetical protein